MSAIAVFWAQKQLVKDPFAKLMLLKLADQANDDGVCWPSRQTLAHDLCCHPSLIPKKARVLEEMGLITRVARRRQNGSSTSNVYQLHIAHGLLIGTDTGEGIRRDTPGGLRPPEPTQKEPAAAAGASAKRVAYDALWEAFIAAGVSRPSTKAERQKLNAAVRQLLEIAADPAEIAPRMKLYQRNYPGIKPTAMGLVAHWTESDPKQRSGPIPLLACPECKQQGIKNELPLPAWKEHRYHQHDAGRVCLECGGVVMLDRKDSCPCGQLTTDAA